MGQLNINMTPAFEEDLRRLMRARSFSTKSQAIRVAVQESLDRALRRTTAPDFRTWIGTALSRPPNPEPRFRSDVELWQ